LQPNGSVGESNAGLVVGDGASLLVDTLWDLLLTRRMLAAIAPLTAKVPVETLVNSHSDGDHWRGNQELERIPIVATDAAAGRSVADTARELVLGEEIAERGFADWLGPERALISVRTIDAHRRGVVKLPGPREVIAAFFRTALLARDLQTRQGLGAGDVSATPRQDGTPSAHSTSSSSFRALPAGARTTPPTCETSCIRAATSSCRIWSRTAARSRESTP